MSESVLRGTNPTFVGTMVDGRVVGVAIADTPKPAKNKPVDGIEAVIMDLVQRVETLEKTIRGWTGD